MYIKFSVTKKYIYKNIFGEKCIDHIRANGLFLKDYFWIYTLTVIKNVWLISSGSIYWKAISKLDIFSLMPVDLLPCSRQNEAHTWLFRKIATPRQFSQGIRVFGTRKIQRGTNCKSETKLDREGGGKM